MVFFQYYQEKVEDIEDEYSAKEPGFTGDSLDSPGLNKLAIKQDARLTADDELILEVTDATELLTEEPVIESEAEAEAAAESVQQRDTGSSSESTVKVTVDKPEQDVLEINAAKGSWMEVRDANNVRLFYNTVPKGGTKILLGKAPFSISLGNAKTTRLVINDLEIDMAKLIRSNNTAKFKVSSEKQNVIFH